jgi:predicted kinase
MELRVRDEVLTQTAKCVEAIARVILADTVPRDQTRTEMRALADQADTLSSLTGTIEAMTSQ